jgi:hypothetical protein
MISICKKRSLRCPINVLLLQLMRANHLKWLSWPNRLFLGNVAEEVVRIITIPVLLIHAREEIQK